MSYSIESCYGPVLCQQGVPVFLFSLSLHALTRLVLFAEAGGLANCGDRFAQEADAFSVISLKEPLRFFEV
jgi:hypothetical protein